MNAFLAGFVLTSVFWITVNAFRQARGGYYCQRGHWHAMPGLNCPDEDDE